MAVIRCPSGHFYDDKKYQTCPHCRTMESVSGGAQRDPAADLREDRTVSARKVNFPSVPVPDAEEVSELDKTVSIFHRGQSKAVPGFPVGWLVCTDGPEKGREYRLIEGRNFAGSSEKMDVCLSGDPEIEAENQFSVIYDPKSRQFLLLSGGNGLTYLNGTAVSAPSELQDWDRIEVGGTTLTFRSFCGEGFQWA